MDVRLSWSEVLMAAEIGLIRNISSLKSGRSDNHGYDGRDSWTVHVEGASGEMAVAKHLDIYWDGSVNSFHAPDVGAFQVRTRSREDWDLIVRENDKADEVFILVVGKVPRFRVCGWIYGRDAKRSEWLQGHGDRPPAYFVPQSALNPVEGLRDLLEVPF